MRKISLYFALIAALAFLPLSCNKNIPDGIDPETDNGSQPSPDQVFWRVVGQLVDRSQRTDDYKDKSFAPTIGVPDNGDESVRIVLVNDLGAAVTRFNNLVGADITEETSAYTYSNPEVGTLVWNKSTDGKSWGTVDVNIRQVPLLQKIIYRSADQGDTNGTFGGGSAYYRFGDVIERYRDDDGVTEYWVCVRPAFDPEDKDKSHWVSVSPLPDANLWPYYKNGQPFTASNDKQYGLPYNLGDDLEWAQDLAEMLFAIMYPTEWNTNLQSGYSENILGRPNGLRMFNDFDYNDNGALHNVYFWQNVQKKWREWGLVYKLFGITYEEMERALDPQNGRGLHFIYDEYSWSTTFSNKPTLYQVHYGHGSDKTQKNMHLQTKTSVTHQVVKPKEKGADTDINFGFNFRTETTERRPYIIKERFFGDTHPRWCIRYAEGKTLSENGIASPQQPLKGFGPGESGETYRYYRDILQKNLTDAPEESAKPKDSNDPSNPFAGHQGFFYPGVVIKDEDGMKWVCYSGWIDLEGVAVTKDKKARFFNFGRSPRSENSKILYQDELPSLDDAASLLYVLSSASKVADDPTNVAAKEYLNLDLSKFFTLRDSTFQYNDISSQSDIKCGNILYEPGGGREAGTQPYLRLVIDGTHSGENRTKLPRETNYDATRFYSIYTDGSEDILDLTHVFSSVNYVTAGHPIPADKWSRCKHHGTEIRDGAFTVDDLYKNSYVDMSNFSIYPQEYRSAYRDPVLALRYLELDDDSPSFKGTYGGKSYTLLHEVSGNEKFALQFNLTNRLAFSYNRPNSLSYLFCTLNDMPYQLDLLVDHQSIH